MTLSRQPYGTIAQRKQAVRAYSRKTAIYGGVGLAVGIPSALVLGHKLLVLLSIICFVAAGVNFYKARRIVTYKEIER